MPDPDRPGRNERHAWALLRRVVRSQRLAVLATNGQGCPYCSLVAFVASDDLKHLFFATPRGTWKFANLARDARVAMLLDNRSNRASDFRRGVAATALGRAHEITGDDARPALRRYLLKHPQLEGLASRPDCALVRVEVERYVVAAGVDDVRELRPA